MLAENARLIEKTTILHGVLHSMGFGLPELHVAYPHGPSVDHTCSESCPPAALSVVVRVGDIAHAEVCGVFRQPAPFIQGVAEEVKLAQNVWDAQRDTVQMQRMSTLFSGLPGKAGKKAVVRHVRDLQERLKLAGLTIKDPWFK